MPTAITTSPDHLHINIVVTVPVSGLPVQTGAAGIPGIVLPPLPPALDYLVKAVQGALVAATRLSSLIPNASIHLKIVVGGITIIDKIIGVP